MTLGRLGDFIIVRIPSRQNIALIFGTSTFLTYTWTVVVSFWKIPSWLFYLKTSQIIAIYSYSFIVNCIESLSLAALMILMGLILPKRWWFENFVPVSVVALLSIMISIAWHSALYQHPELRDVFVASQLFWWFETAGLIAFLSFLAIRIKIFNTLLSNLADRFAVFLYLYIPLTIISLLVVVIRNIG